MSRIFIGKNGQIEKLWLQSQNHETVYFRYQERNAIKANRDQKAVVVCKTTSLDATFSAPLLPNTPSKEEPSDSAKDQILAGRSRRVGGTPAFPVSQQCRAARRGSTSHWGNPRQQTTESGASAIDLLQSGLATILDVGAACRKIAIQGVFGGRIVSTKLVGQGAHGIGRGKRNRPSVAPVQDSHPIHRV